MSEDPFDFSSYRGPSAPGSPPGSPPPTGSGSPPPFDPFTTQNSGAASTGWHDDPFRQTSTASGATRPALVGKRPPLGWLWLGLGLGIVGLALAALSLSGVAIYVVGWAVGGPVAITVLTIYARKDTAAQTSPFYASETWVPLIYRIAFVLCLLAVIAEALRIGHWAGYR